MFSVRTILNFIILMLLANCGDSRRLLSHLRHPKSLPDHQPDQRCVTVEECPPLAVIADDEQALEEYQRCNFEQVTQLRKFFSIIAFFFSTNKIFQQI